MEALMIKSSHNLAEHNDLVNDIKNKIIAEHSSALKREPSIREIANKNFNRRNTRKVTRKQTVIAEFNVDENKVGRAEKTEIFSFFLFALSWAMGGFLEENNKKLLNDLLYKLYSNSLGKGTGAVPLDVSKKLGPIYVHDSFFTHFYNTESKNWES